MKKIFVCAMPYGEGKSGTSVYINNVVYTLCKSNKVEILLLENDTFPFEHANLTIIRIPNWLGKPLINMIWHLFILPFSYDYSIYDMVLLPSGNRRLFCRDMDNLVVTFHDLSQFHIAKKYGKLRTIYIKTVVPYFLKKIKKIVAISQSTKDDIVKFYGISADRILVNHNGYAKPNTNFQICQTKIITNKKYILYVARLEHPGKNHLNLLKAYEILPEKTKTIYDLVLPGQDWVGSKEVKNYWQSMNCHANIHFPGFISNKMLDNLYSNASLYVFPSFFEGFGLPLLEAMAYKVPVICSNTPPLVEVGGNAIEIFNPDSPDDICEKIVMVLNDKILRENLIEKGSQRLTHFSWAEHTKNILLYVDD